MVLALPRAALAQALDQGDVGLVISRVVQEAKARNTPATIAVVDRFGAVLGLYAMAGAPASVMIANNPNGSNAQPGLNGANVPSALAAIAKADTAAYLSTSAGNAFSTRTASQIIQDHFDPGTNYAASGPLYGVQFSSLPCSDLAVRWSAADPSSQTRGPHRSPLGLAGDPGGLPLYKSGVLVGAVGVKASGSYGVVLNTQSTAQSVDEELAFAGTYGLAAPAAIQANHVTVNGLLLSFSNAGANDLVTNPATAPAFSALPPGLISVPTYFSAAGGLGAGSAYGSASSGLMQDNSGSISTAAPPYVLVGANGTPRYPVRAGAASAGALSATETLTILRNAYAVALMARANLRPPGQHAAVTISIVDLYGDVLAVASVPDAALFGVDVSLQKARSAVFLSNPAADAALQVNATTGFFRAQANADFGYAVFAQSHGWSARAIGNIARDTLPDGINGTLNGPLSLAAKLTTPFADGLQIGLAEGDLLSHLAYLAAPSSKTDPAFCTPLPPLAGAPSATPTMANGLQVFPGGFPIYRNATLVGGIGVSGDGVDQDDMVAFLGLHNAGVALNSGIGNAPAALRANLLRVHGVLPVYVSCPTSPFLNSDAENVCNGL